MGKVQMNRAEAEQIQEVADRFAKRINGRFVLDQARVEIVDSEGRNDGNPQATSQKQGLNVG